MRLNTIKPTPGTKSTPKRVGRGTGSGLGKTSARGHKGQKSRAGSTKQVGFEGGQMPLQRRLPKRGFVSPMRNDVAQVRLHELNKIDADPIDLATLKSANIVPKKAKRAKVILSGKLERAVNLKGITTTKGAADAVQKAGGKVEA